MSKYVSTITKLNETGRLKRAISSYINDFCAHDNSWAQRIIITPRKHFFQVTVDWLSCGNVVKSISYDITDLTFDVSGDSEYQTPILNKLWRSQIKRVLTSEELMEYEASQTALRQSLTSQLIDAKVFLASESE